MTSLLQFAGLSGFECFSQGTSFTYQGRLNSGGVAANGLFDFRFRLAADPLANNYVDGPFLTNGIGVTNGLFITTVDFGPGVFSGSNYWLEVDVRTNGAGAYTTLSPLQSLTPTPYAIFANGASNLLGTLPAAQLSGPVANANLPANPTISGMVTAGSFGGDGSGLTNLNASQLAGGVVPDARLAANVARTNQVWLLTGNAGTAAPLNFFGTTDSNAVEMRVNNTRAWRVEPDARGLNAANLIGGYSNNAVMQPNSGGNVIAGGGYSGGGNIVFSNSSGIFIGAGSANQAGPNVNDSAIVGGYGNWLQSSDSAIGGGYYNGIQGNSPYSLVAGGGYNLIGPNAFGSTIGGGYINTNLSAQSSIGGGAWNIIAPGNAAFIGGGVQNFIDHDSYEATIAGGWTNQLGNSSAQSFIGGGFHNVILSNSVQTVITGGSQNTNATSYAFIGGGALNFIQSNNLGVFVGGGFQNDIQPGSSYSAIPGGDQNTIQGNSIGSFIGGGAQNTILTNSPSAFIGGGFLNVIQASSADSTIGGGSGNVIQTNADHATIAGGFNNSIQGIAWDATIGGGYGNVILPIAQYAFIGGGNYNTNGGVYSAVGGGNMNFAGGAFSAIPGGNGNAAAGIASFAAGTYAQATNNGAFVLADNEYTNFSSTASNQLSMRFTGGIRFVTGGTGVTLDGQPMVSGSYAGVVTLNNGGNSFSGNGGGLTNLQISAVGPAGTFGLNSIYFGGAQTLAAGSGPSALAVVDANGDGKPDLISANEWDGTLAVLTNNGSGAFGLNAVLATGPDPIAVAAVTNFNGHGGMALVSANSGTNTLTIWTNNGSGAFKLLGTFVVSDTNNFPQSVVTADVNGDGKPDLVCLNSDFNPPWEQSTLTVLTNNGIGGFGSNSMIVPGGYYGTVLQAVDVNGDGRLDLVFDEPSYGSFGVLTNNGSGGFGPYYLNYGQANLFYYEVSIAAADINGDGKPDLLLVSYGTQNETNFVYTPENDLLVFTNNGSGFGLNAIYDAGTTNGNNHVTFCAAADVNGDGKPDAVIASGPDTTLTIMLNNGNGTFTFNATQPVSGFPVYIAAGDFNGDGKTDLATANSGSTVSVFLSATQTQTNLTVTDMVTMTNGLNSFGGTFGGDGTGLINVNAATLNGLSSSAFAPASGSASYIQNQSVTGQAASFNISGSAVVGSLTNAGNESVGGLLLSGSGTGTGNPPWSGLVVRRVNSVASTVGNIVARTDSLTLERDGSSEGLLIRYPAGVSRQTINCLAQSYYGTNIIVHASLNNPGSGGTIQLLTSAQHAVHAEISFGNTFNNGHLTKVSLDRYDDGTTSDFYWVGNLISTYNQ